MFTTFNVFHMKLSFQTQLKWPQFYEAQCRTMSNVIQCDVNHSVTGFAKKSFLLNLGNLTYLEVFNLQYVTI